MNTNDIFTRRVFGLDYRVWETMFFVCFFVVAMYGFKEVSFIPTNEAACLVDTMVVNGKKVEYVANCDLGRYYQFAIQSDDAAAVEWNFRDNTNTEKGPIVSHKFTREGTFRVTATLNGRCKFDALVDVTFNPLLAGEHKKPIVEIFADPEHPTVDSTVKFYCASDLASISSYEWKVSNTGEVKTDAEPAFTFRREDEFEIQLIINEDHSRIWKAKIQVANGTPKIDESSLKDPFGGTPANSLSLGKLVTEEVNTPIPSKGPGAQNGTGVHPENPVKPDSTHVISPSKPQKLDPDAFKELLQNVVDQKGKEVEDLYDYLDYRESTKVMVNENNNLMPLKDFCKTMRGKNRNRRKIEALSLSKKDDKDGSQYIKVKVPKGKGPFGWF